MIELTKECTCCNKEFPFTEFTRDKTAKFGFKSMCKTCRSEIRKELDRKNPQVLIKQRKRTYRNNREKRLAENKVNYLKNKPKHIAKARKYDLSKLNRTPKWITTSDLKVIECYYNIAIRVSSCLSIPHHVDHIIPLQGTVVSGLHTPLNLEVIPAKLNLQKGNKWQIY